ncbi:unnamed protein product [Oppiella nova]|uniref:Uncharacterized protein n=1 Tax=Oppiella nova TaxID=334625 RepID=A0A7R9QTQ7_9ACAR|nr:unnamed protein product [Oppiella nova]CAG2175306.1 unnamed protein product [Oppiella nova]
MSQKRIHYHSLIPNTRLDSRLLLKSLIAFNIVLAVYNIITLQSNTSSKANPCLIVINTSKHSTNAHNSLQKADFEPQNVANPEVTPINGQLFDTRDKPSDRSEDKPNMSSNISEDKTKILNARTRAPIWWSTETRGSYTVLKNFIPGDDKPQPLESVTLTTQGTHSFLYHIENLCLRWDGHISVAVYAPGLDFPLVVNLIHYLRKCRDPCVKAKTSWHLVYDTLHNPHSNASYPDSYVEDMDFDCTQSYSELTDRFNTTFRSDHSLPYPINVVRNVARLNAQTKYIFASDIELYPSLLSKEESKY